MVASVQSIWEHQVTGVAAYLAILAEDAKVRQILALFTVVFSTIHQNFTFCGEANMQLLIT